MNASESLSDLSVAAKVEAAQRGLPKPWIAKWGASRGEVYYANPDTRTTTYVRPEPLVEVLDNDVPDAPVNASDFPSLVDTVVRQDSRVFTLHLGIASAFKEHALEALRASSPTAPTALWSSPLLRALLQERSGVFAAWETQNKRRRGASNPHFFEDVTASLQLVAAAVRYCRVEHEPAPDTVLLVTLLMRFTE